MTPAVVSSCFLRNLSYFGKLQMYGKTPVFDEGSVREVNMSRFLSKALGFTGNVIKYGCVTHCTFEYLGDFVVCSGPSMEPTLYSNNILVTERISPRVANIHRGDIIIAKCPTNPTQHICKRVIGLPGDKVISTESYSGRLIDEMKVRIKKEENTNPGTNPTKRIFETYVPRGQVWLEGDNTANSSDSRFYGPVPMGLVKSRVLCRVWPLDQMKMLI